MYCCFVDVLIYIDLPQNEKKLNDVCEKMRKLKTNIELDAHKKRLNQTFAQVSICIFLSN